MHDITSTTFINTLFGTGEGLFDENNERPVIGYPSTFIKSGEEVSFFKQMHFRERALVIPRSWYYCVSTVEAQYGTQVKKRLRDVKNAVVLVCDDIGTKSKPLPVRPSFVIETSAGNYQWGYILQPFDVSTPDGAEYYDSCLRCLAEAGYNDAGFRSANRFARLPGSLHKSGFAAVVDHWHPERVWDLEVLMDELGVKVSMGRRRKIAAVGTIKNIEDITDPIYLWLLDQGKVLGHGEDWIDIVCPWKDQHTDGADIAGYSPENYGMLAHASFNCFHGHCQHKNIGDFKTWLQQQRNK